MSLKIIKAGILDTIQDPGRYGHQHQGINPGGAADRFSAALANALLGKELGAPLIEMHFPAAQILFKRSAVICLTGADFTPVINDKEVSLHQPVVLNENTVLQFRRRRSGARCYLSVTPTVIADKWLNSYSTNLKAEAGGYKGRQLKKADVLPFGPTGVCPANNQSFETLPWKYNVEKNNSNEIKFLFGNEWGWLTKEAQTAFLNNEYTVTPASDRMGFRLQGEALEQRVKEQLVSSPVNFGTVELLPGGQLIVLMADHQTTGGYPRIAHVISTHLPRLAQMQPGGKIKFVMTDIKSAEEKLMTQQAHLRNLQNVCRLKMQNRFHAY